VQLQNLKLIFLFIWQQILLKSLIFLFFLFSLTNPFLFIFAPLHPVFIFLFFPAALSFLFVFLLWFSPLPFFRLPIFAEALPIPF